MWTDLNLWRSLATVLAFACFLGIVLWAWLGGRNNGFGEAAALPFEADDPPFRTESPASSREKQDE